MLQCGTGMQPISNFNHFSNSRIVNGAVSGAILVLVLDGAPTLYPLDVGVHTADSLNGKKIHRPALLCYNGLLE